MPGEKILISHVKNHKNYHILLSGVKPSTRKNIPLKALQIAFGIQENKKC